MRRRPTLVGVADRADVSIASVSRVLNGKPARPDADGLIINPLRGSPELVDVLVNAPVLEGGRG